MLLITVPRPSPLERAARAIRPAEPVLATALALSVASVLAGASLAPGLATLGAAFDADPGALWVRLVVSMPALGVPVGAALTGVAWQRMGDVRGLLIAALWAYAACGVGPALGVAPWAMLALRFLQGVALGTIMLSALRLLTRADPAALPRRLALQSIVMTVATLMILPLAALASGLSWRLPFLLSLLPLTLVPALGALRAGAFIHEPTPGAGAAPDDRRPLLAGLLLAGAAMVVFFSVPTQMPGYLAGQDRGGAGAAAALIALSVLAASVAGGVLRRHGAGPLPAVPVLTGGFAALALGAFQLAYADRMPPVALGVVLIGAGFGVLFPTLNHWAIAARSPAAASRAAAAVTAAFHIGQFAAPLVGSAAIRPDAPQLVFLPYLILAGAAALLVMVERRAFWPEPGRLPEAQRLEETAPDPSAAVAEPPAIMAA